MDMHVRARAHTHNNNNNNNNNNNTNTADRRSQIADRRPQALHGPRSSRKFRKSQAAVSSNKQAATRSL
jgi:hypothetical protein